ncbi:SseB protein N-terminal domain-containing protein [Saccharopolyspora antimicrobica]|uniref:SseB protein N-terminal domain-containing protein n=2 Tax=Saccharopolyspora antimicrobica TaxID=455193 RepID=A0A1I5AC45_9PSEU|nr:type III secretion system (T3SS) SseB-like protein [Saccharopolyspora antimicrobica]SFN59779.1 SseB protein N-terminal domain-containing protein [Saccharopolyspora antimicrobica]
MVDMITGAGRTEPGGPPLPTDVERALYAAKVRGDWDGYLRVLLANDMFSYSSKAQIDSSKLGLPHWQYLRGPDGRKLLPVYTRGALLPRRPDVVAHPVELPLSRVDGVLVEWRGVVVNPGTPTEAHFPGVHKQRKRWKALKESTPRADVDAILRTEYTGPLHGPLAHGLACGALLATHNKVVWNDIGDSYDHYAEDVLVLRDAWNVTDRDGCLGQLSFLLRGVNSPAEIQFLLGVRNAMTRRWPGAQDDAEAWRKISADQFLALGNDPGRIPAIQELIGRILRYESRFRADGVLPPDGRVTSTLGYDYGRAVNFARWGLSARYLTFDEAEQAILEAGELSRKAHSSWADFSAGYILGRVLRFDEESYGEFYHPVVAAHRILLNDPSSPWHNIPFNLD